LWGVANIRFSAASRRASVSASEKVSEGEDLGMGYTRELTEEEVRFCASLGGIVIFWNHVESTMRGLVERSVRIGEGQQRVSVLIAHLGNVALVEALNAISDDHHDEIRPHLRHCATLFDSERVYRNYYVHNPITFETRGAETKGYAHHITAKGGALKAHNGRITTEQLEAFHDRLSALQSYINALVNHSCGMLQTPLSSLEMPPLPDKLELHRLRLIERSPPPQA
jgi:hypothetical protein